MAKKLLFVSHSAALDGGAELSFVELIKEARRRGHQLIVTLPGKGPFSDMLDELGIEYRIIFYTWSAQSNEDQQETKEEQAIYNADSILSAHKLMSKYEPDLVVSNTITIPWFIYAANTLGIPSIMIIRELFDVRNGLRLLPTDEAYLNTLAHEVTYFMYNSEFTRNEYEKYLGHKDSSVLYPIVKIPEKYQKNTTEILKNDNVKTLVFGSIIEHKNQLDAIKAIGHLVTEGHKNFSLTVMGRFASKSYREDLEFFIEKNGLRDFVKFKPFTPTPFEEIGEHDVIITPSKFEAFGRVTLEAQLLARLVIGSDSSGTKELIKEGSTGFLYPPGDTKALAAKLIWAKNNKMKAQKIAKKAQMTSSKRFSGDSVMEPFFQIIKDRKLSKIGMGNTNYSPIGALIKRNFHVNNILKNYADSLSEAKNHIESLEKENEKLRKHPVKESLQKSARRAIRRLKRN